MSVVIGIDPGIAGFHVAAVHVEDDALLLMRVASKTDRFQIPSALLSYLFEQTTATMTTVRSQWPDDRGYVFIEEPPVAGARNLRTALKLAQAVGAIVASVTGSYTRCYFVPVATWKKATVGKGNATKQEVALWLSRLHPSYAAQCDGSQDLTDACCIARYGIGVVADATVVRAIGSTG